MTLVEALYAIADAQHDLQCLEEEYGDGKSAETAVRLEKLKELLLDPRAAAIFAPPS
jgi:hypothetical protein